MPIDATCTCGGRFRAPDRMAGKSVRCPKCSGTFAVPQPVPEPVLAVAGADGPALSEARPGPVLEKAGEDAAKGRSQRTSRGLLDAIGGAVPARARGAVAGLALPVFLSYVLLGLASGLGMSMVCMFFGDPDGTVEGLIFMMMIVMSLIFMSSISPVLAVLTTAAAAPRASSKVQAGVVAAISAGAGTFAMFVIYGLMFLISFAIFGPSSSGSSSGGKMTEGAGDFGTFAKILLATFLPVISAGFASGVIFWRAKTD